MKLAAKFACFTILLVSSLASADDWPIVFHDWDFVRLAGRPEAGAALTAEQWRELAYLEASWPSDLPVGIIPADLFPDNVFFLGDKLSAERAKECGLIWDVAPHDALFDRAFAVAASLATQATRGYGLTKRALNASFANSLDAQLEVEAEAMHEAGKTADYEEGVRAFLAKRKPVYRGA